jgi:hypothetical protein
LVVGLSARSNGPRRQWFTDARDSGRHMEVSWHRDQQLVIIGLWQGSICRATFRMPIKQAADAIRALADALGDAAENRPSARGVAPRGNPLRSLLDRMRDRLGRVSAEVVDLHQVKPLH